MGGTHIARVHPSITLRAYPGDDMYRNACQAVFPEYWDSYMDPDMLSKLLKNILEKTFRVSSTLTFSSLDFQLGLLTQRNNGR